MIHYRFSRDCYEQIIAQGKEYFPMEACGLLISHTPQCISHIIPITNIHPQAEHFFEFDPQQWIQAYYSCIKQDQQIVGIYHTHPTSPPIPSEHDCKGYIGESNWIYCIVSLQINNEPSCQLYQYSNNMNFTPLPIIWC